MTEINKKNDLAVIPPTNNDGDPYVLPLDIFKEGYTAYNISNWFKGRVGDNGTPFAIRWYSHGRLLNILGMRPFIEGQVGDYTIDDSDPDNPQINMAEDASNIHIVGDVDDSKDGGVAIYRLISQAFPKSGIFYGKIGFMGTQDDGTLVNTGVDIVFKVLSGHMNMLGARKFYVSELEKAWLDLQAKIRKYQAEYKDTTTKQAEQFKEDTEKALADLNTKIANEIKRAEDTLGDTQAAIDANIASLKKIAASVGALQAQIDADNLETQADHKADIDGIKADYDLKLSNIKHPVEAFDSFSQLQAKYPNGKDGDFVTTDTGHIYIFSWVTNSWKDCGQYQTTGISDNSVNADKLVNYTAQFATYVNPLVVDWENCTIQLLGGYHLIFKGRKSVALPACTFSFKVPDSKGEMNPPLNGVVITFKKLDTAATQKAPETQFKIYDFGSSTSNPATIPDDEVYLGWLDYLTKRFNFVFPAITNDKIPADNDLNEIVLLDKKELTLSANDWVTQHPIQVNFKKPSITIKGFSAVSYKDKFAVIPAGEYILKNPVGDTKYFLYWGYDKQLQKYTIEVANTPDEIPLTCPYLGWIQTDWQKYKFANGQSWDLIAGANDWVTQHPIQVNFKKPSITIKGFSAVSYKDKFAVIPAGEYILKNPVGDTKYFLYWGYDKQLQKYTIEVANTPDEIPLTCPYLGWIQTDWQKYKFANGQSSELEKDYPWANKNITCFGDSITWGMQEDNDRTVSYAHLLPNLTLANVIEVGQNGSAICETDSSTPSFIDRVDTIKDQDLVTVLGGTNDFGRNIPLGTMKDTETNTKTFYGALKYLIIHITNNNPNARVMFMTPPKLTDNIYPHTYDSEGNLVKNAAGFTEEDYVNAIKKVCSYYSIPVLDLYNDGPYNPFIPAQRAKYTNDGLHPNQAGQDLLAGTISKAINNLC